MVGSSLTHRGEELLGQRGGVEAYVERGSTFGVPLLYPWANRLSGDTYRGVDLTAAPRTRRDPNGLPIHGLLHAWPHWEVTEHTDDRLRARTDLSDLAGFPFPHALEQHVHLTPTALSIATMVRATGDVEVPVSFGYHPYLAVTEDDRLEVPARTHVAPDDRGLPTGATMQQPAETVALAGRELDDLYTGLPHPPAFTLVTSARRITVTFDHGYPVAQLYHPPGQGLLAIEPMTAPTNALVTGEALPTVPPGGTFVATFSISVDDAPTIPS
ncbi:MAG: aldose 1-epimerase [Solirubrobacteraceae bacterium]|nr:aldose 1-epimerase [Solirubrobacteraceae bacterium]